MGCDFIPHFVVMSSLIFFLHSFTNSSYCAFSVDDDVSPSDEGPGDSTGIG